MKEYTIHNTPQHAATPWSIQHLSSHAVRHKLHCADQKESEAASQRNQVWRWIFKTCMNKFSICFQLPGHIKVNKWASVQHIKHGAKPFRSHQLTGMCNTVQRAVGCVCQHVLVSVCAEIKCVHTCACSLFVCVWMLLKFVCVCVCFSDVCSAPAMLCLSAMP